MVPEIVVNTVEELKGQVPIYQICLHLNIPRSTYYRWKQHTKRDTLKEWMEQQVGEQCHKHKFRYGYRKITALLNRTMKINHKFVQRAMQKYGW